MNRTSQAGRDTASSSGARPTPPDDRYRRGTRRTGAEPLTASWEPAGRRHRKRRRGLKGLIANYGWRIYALPVLLVLTALVVLDTAAPTRLGSAGEESAAQTAASTAAGPPVASETPPPKVDLVNIPTAVLPDGPKFSEQGTGTWQVVPGTTPQVGQGKVYKYAIAVEDGVEAADYGGDRDAFARTIDGILADTRSWIGTGEVAMQRVDGTTPVDFTVSLTTTSTTHSLCGFQIQYETSCWHPPTERVVINTARWVRGAKAFSNDLSTYRAYAINHEVGHALKNNHEGCQENGQPAPVMMQQTFGVANDYVAQLNEVDSSNRGIVPADGKTCTPNAFPVAPK
ncbi:hypothetical protein FHS29_002713 [Saccharothrix tamanrassetensis]|uniref:DUF3152 domain-containing protein n=1 Tax=Saccharothrix tamanrassetensis TaxID=1051531 RepID=A0A841CJ29_9PSEU|nr:DUF3152 domain-containing protein [Saccharothrix tamanrassetensis]MBB5956127.1 hypothetical protein [Saccharothrix tamanrassetensis]